MQAFYLSITSALLQRGRKREKERDTSYKGIFFEKFRDQIYELGFGFIDFKCRLGVLGLLILNAGFFYSFMFFQAL